MKKIIAAFDCTKYADGGAKYAIEIAAATNSLLVGVFIQDMRYVNMTYAYAWDQPFVDFTAIENSQKEEKEKADLNIKLFSEACEARGIKYKVHLDKGVPLQELLKESSFADLLVIDTKTSFTSLGEGASSAFIKDLLSDAHCPVLTVPAHYQYFDKLILCYDGSPSSVYAIKMFSYLFHELEGLPTVLLSVNASTSNHLVENSNIKDLLKLRYNKAVDYVILNGDPEQTMIDYLSKQGEHAMVVMGAYGRSAISRLFQQSFSNRVIQELKLPVFITHQ